jgi:HEAT repeat protein
MRFTSRLCFHVRFLAAAALGRFGGVQTVNALIAALNDEDEDVRSAAALSLTRVGGERGRVALISRLRIDLADGGAVVSSGPTTGPQSPPFVFAGLKSANRIVRALAVAVLSFDESEESVAALIKETRYPDVLSPGWAVTALLRMRRERARQAVHRILQGNHQDDPVSPIVEVGRLHLIADELGYEKCDWAVPALIDPLERHPITSVQGAAASALGRIGGERALAALLRAVDSPAGDLRRSVAWALGAQGDVRALDAVTRLLHDEYPEARTDAAMSLGRIGGDRALAALVEAIKDD